MGKSLLIETATIFISGEKENKKASIRGDVLPSFYSIHSGSADYASGLRVIGSLLLELSGSLAHYRIA